MFLSIIIPHYNLPRELLERCLASITRLNIADEHEIIVVDDGSNEPPLWINEAYTDKNVRLITAPHGGPGAARNRGMDEAKGTYIEFVDADDILIPGSAYSQCTSKLHSERPQILHFNYSVVADAGKQAAEENREITFSNTISGATYMIKFNLPGSPCRYFFSRALAQEKNIRFPENILHEDEEFNTILHFHARTLVYSDATLYRYCIREGSTTANTSKEFERKRIDDMLHIIEHLAKFRETQESCTQQAKGFEHKLTMLAVDAIVNMLRTGMKSKEIYTTCMERLAPLGLYPLPKASYSIKYRIFRMLANSKCGIRILRCLTPSRKPLKR